MNEVKDKKFKYYGGSLKNLKNLKKKKKRKNCEKEGVVFLRGECTLCK